MARGTDASSVPRERCRAGTRLKITGRLAGNGHLAAPLLVPACFLVAPFIAFLAHNSEAAVGAWEVLRYPAIAMLPLTAVMLAIWFFAGRPAADRAAVLTAAVLLAFFNYGALRDGLEGMGVPMTTRLAAWVVVVALLVIAAFALSRHRSVPRFLSIAGVILVALPLVQYLATDRADRTVTASVGAPTEPTFRRTPDIYYIVPDAYARADVLADEFGFDNSPFLDALRERGFLVVDDALTHYPVTFLSMASTLDMGYVVEPAQDALAGGREPFYDRLRGQSAVHRRLEAEGYVHVAAPPGPWEGTECSGVEDLCVEPVSNQFLGGLLGEVEWELAHLTPLGELIDGSFTDSFTRPFADPAHAVRTARQADLDAPAFVQVHMLQTHTPFQFDRNCRPTPPKTHNLRSWSKAGRAAYVEAIECANRQLLTAIDLIEDDAVVVILADHGPGFTLDMATPFEEWTDETLRERYSVLSAYLLPRPCRGAPQPSPVNVFRVVFSCLGGAQAELLADRWFFAGSDKPEVREMDSPPGRPSDSAHSSPAP